TASDLAGFQGTIQAAEGLTIEGWSSNLLGTGNVNDTQLSRGMLAFSYHENNSLEGVEIITLQLRADTELRISDYLSVTDRITYAEAVAPVGSTSALRLSFSQAPGGENFMLHQNFPNPVAAQTTVEFDLPTSSECLLQVHDLQGRLLTERLLQGVAGRNSITLSANLDLKNTTGILTYSLRVGQERLTKRMTVVAH
ncbi:MAG: T9SS type A sorting domain-containing protein, partial [Bacteroidota bacterium]